MSEAPKENMTHEENPECKTHPCAPHGFNPFELFFLGFEFLVYTHRSHSSFFCCVVGIERPPFTPH
jgi:hypothetical protein